MQHEPGSMDISQHKGMYSAFVTLSKFTIIASVIVLAGMALFLV
ncbi:MAG: aa3-type cytochrome c oxidase subunit IV [Minwuia sp.]|nr:aa3-type cytochrome c oxidase subunit IV [Minwuia sp.]